MSVGPTDICNICVSIAHSVCYDNIYGLTFGDKLFLKRNAYKIALGSGNVFIIEGYFPSVTRIDEGFRCKFHSLLQTHPLKL